MSNISTEDLTVFLDTANEYLKTLQAKVDEVKELIDAQITTLDDKKTTIFAELETYISTTTESFEQLQVQFNTTYEKFLVEADEQLQDFESIAKKITTREYVSNGVTNKPKWYYDIFSINISSNLNSKNTQDYKFLYIALPIYINDENPHLFRFDITGYCFTDAEAIDINIVGAKYKNKLLNQASTGTNSAYVFINENKQVIVRLEATNWYNSSLSFNYFTDKNYSDEFISSLRSATLVNLGDENDY